MTRTLPRALLDAAAQGRGGYAFVGDGDRVEPYAAILAAARAMGGALRARGLAPGDRVALVLLEPRAFLTTFLGAAAAGLVPVPVAYPFQHGDGAAWVERVSPLLRAAEARAIVTVAPLAALLAGAPAVAPAVRFVATREELDGPALTELAAPADDDPALVQFTSGSTSEPKGVVLTHANLAANIAAISGPGGLAFGDAEVGVCWLPLFHDMGLIGQALCPLYRAVTGVFLSPAVFAKRPVDWLSAITRYRGTICFAPNFAYELCVRRVRDADLDGLDLASWRVAGCGGEPIHAATLDAFVERFARAGFRRAAFVPSYGLAEHSLAVTLSPWGRGPRVDTVSATALERGAAQPCAPDAPDAVRVVSCGPPFPGHAVGVVDGARVLGERRVGEIVVTGPSVMRGYLDAPHLTGEVLRDGWLRTGDLGYLADGELHVCGRAKEMIIVNGRNYFPQDLERVAAGVAGARAGRVAIFGVSAPGRADRVVVVAEAGPRVIAGAFTAELQRRLIEATGLAVHEVVLVPGGTIGRTSSGKLQRAELRERYVAGRLPPAAPRERALAALGEDA